MTKAIAPILYYRSAKTEKINIDTENKVIKNVIMAKVGEARGHGEWVELSFIKDLVKYAKSKLKKDGVRCYFGHNYSNLGKRVGKFFNVRVEGDCAIGDLHLYESANDSPILPGAADYILSMANEDEKSIMLSIKYKPEQYYQYDGNNKKVRVWYYDEKEGWISPNRKLKIYVEFKELISCDIVDDGALTDSLYDSGEMLLQFNDIIHHPNFSKILETNYESFTPLNQFYSNKNDGGVLKLLKKLFHSKSIEMPKENKKPETPETEVPAPEKPTEETTDLQKLEEKFDKKVNDLKSDYEKKFQKQEEKIKELEADPAAPHTEGESEEEDPKPDAKRSYHLNPINQKAERFKKKD